MIYYISGGERSGKSSYAQNLALSLSDNPVYLATSRNWDADFEKRVKRHQSDRDERWENIEEEKHIGAIDLHEKVVVVDCVTLWLTNWYSDLKYDVEACLESGKAELKQLFEQDCTLIIISNEIGMGIHAQTEVGRKFTELQGWMNQFIANKADEAVFMVSGLPLKLK
ncbi:bifunctional adenosylcobinamide kinase/adenosylcobinamide-phosphate guanylyltransferase [Fulvivirga ligni]|uniref:bifunctional adenosylcobinamide kinase/adenosylcobinamide-phosphate guanylyltransferase n=1 Tax=Fulvivirga ligni TaxID=2904246 RepID=UPI001F2E49D1|nr:bifunctional adenosylcobinamide kinase/adenosylcobinamide-phosphate guanylyltransferase [Fulvivirga ligni]UII24045.1 bifunctional adenosylcobinamide kinase/adenosylcobinamide-phosphate guanylyltransferase [Fulvivirga ligni]